MISILPMQRFAEPLRITGAHDDRRGPAAGGKRRAGAQPLTPSTKGMLDGGEGTTGLRSRQPCIGPFAHGDQARRAQGSRGPGGQHGDVLSPMSSATRVRNPLDQHMGKHAAEFGHHRTGTVRALKIVFDTLNLWLPKGRNQSGSS